MAYSAKKSRLKASSSDMDTNKATNTEIFISLGQLFVLLIKTNVEPSTKFFKGLGLKSRGSLTGAFFLKASRSSNIFIS